MGRIQKIYLSPKRYLLDITVMVVGLSVLYGIEVFVYLGANTLNLVLYAVAFVTYASTLLSTENQSGKRIIGGTSK